MKLRFRAGKWLGEYHGDGLNLRPGDEADVSGEVGRRLLSDFPDNFEIVNAVGLEAPPKDKMIRRGRVKK